MVNCTIMRMCKFTNDRGVDIFDVVLLDIKAMLFEFERGTIFQKLVTVTAVFLLIK